MKKYLIIFLLFLLPINANAIVFEDCYGVTDLVFNTKDLPKELTEFDLDEEKSHIYPNDKTIDDYKKESFVKYKKKYNKKFFNKDKWMKEAWEFRLLTNGKTIQLTEIFSDEFIAKEATLVKDFGLKKINKFNQPIILFTKNYIEAGNDFYYRLNLKNGTVLVSSDKNFTTSLDLLHCKYNSNKSSYLDYWWAVILIIAITFFIFTQSGKRLKQIRRK